MKTVFITLDDDEYKALNKIKQRRQMTWKEMLLKVEAFLK